MPDPSLHWDTCALWKQLAPVLNGVSIEVLKECASTNTTLLDRMRTTPPQERPDDAPASVHRSVESAAFRRQSADVQPCLLVAAHQTGGRGRQGRPWRSAPGASLTFSLALPLAADWAGLSLAVGVAVADALEPLAPAGPGADRIGLKWPNDLWLMDGAGAGRKLGGILIESVAVGAQRLAVIGIGINVLPLEVNDASSGFACLREIDPAASAPATLHRLALPLALALKQFEGSGFAAFAERFAARDVLLGRPVRTTAPAAQEGIARGVSALGALRVQTASGLMEVCSGEVSVRPVAGSGAAVTGPSC